MQVSVKKRKDNVNASIPSQKLLFQLCLSNYRVTGSTTLSVTTSKKN